MSPTHLEPPSGARDEASTTIDQRTRFGWPVVVTIAGLVFSAAGSVALAKGADSKADEAKAAVLAAEKEQSATDKVQEAALHSHELRIQRVEDAQKVTADAMVEIKASLAAINAKLDAQREGKRGSR